MKKGYLIGLFVGCTLLMMGCSNQQKDSVTDPDTPAVTDSTDITKGEEKVAGQDNMDTGTSDVNGTTAGNGQSDNAGNGQNDADDNSAADTTGSPATSTEKKGTTSSKKSSNSTKKESKKQTSSSSQTEDIGMDSAKKIALGKAGLTEQDGSWKEEKRDKENGRIVYELEFVSGKTEYEFEIDAEDGEILEYKKDSVND